jgi:hypothetical protein
MSDNEVSLTNTQQGDYEEEEQQAEEEDQRRANWHHWVVPGPPPALHGIPMVPHAVIGPPRPSRPINP